MHFFITYIYVMVQENFPSGKMYLILSFFHWKFLVAYSSKCVESQFLFPSFILENIAVGHLSCIKMQPISENFEINYLNC